jgi:hypothetical protein
MGVMAAVNNACEAVTVDYFTSFEDM